ncbi:hypothetical protein SDRG_08787 [Saprolegnia diclina VS20]|uniref:U2A'/phosphoprotein 32 family A C-terminal domain-containing protein n=1 Tax=Saprolegnia diclina (strain VS20) TaxID=1156394 RepID=T0RMW0_SAPDV|nr:hypothetical protein SDRG_08787 [Saprolegnia diclina VS20]EQC33683.1 hypothetical protein SDRG_08787 [Saprolegnia diclina VS20]|eukprot:XP_008612906.1 hypothetical protein SDRG_08787 [Saprolegnia diclina VS20]
MESKRRKGCRGTSLMDVLKAHGMRVVDGTKLNMVNKAIDVIGPVVASVARTTTCVYLSQNNLASLAGLEQFGHLKMLSLGSNAIARFDELAHISSPHLKTLYLVGNPICESPNYRPRVLQLLPTLSVLDTLDISTKERQVSSFLIAQDASLRQLLAENHGAITRLEWLVQRIALHKEFYLVVYGSSSLPPLESMAVNVDLLLRLWSHDAPAAHDATTEGQLERMVVRAYEKLQQYPLRKAKLLLQKLGPAAKEKLKSLATPAAPSWEDAYASVLAVQQNTIAKLRGLCERNRRDLMDAIKSLLVRAPTLRPTRTADTTRVVHSDSERLAAAPSAKGHRQDGLEDGMLGDDEWKRSRRRLPPSGARCGDFTDMTLSEAVNKFEFRHLDSIAQVKAQRQLSPTRRHRLKMPAKASDHVDDDQLEDREAVLRLQMQLMEQSLHERDARTQSQERERALEIQLLEYEHQIRRLRDMAAPSEPLQRPAILLPEETVAASTRPRAAPFGIKLSHLAEEAASARPNAVVCASNASPSLMPSATQGTARTSSPYTNTASATAPSTTVMSHGCLSQLEPPVDDASVEDSNECERSPETPSVPPTRRAKPLADRSGIPINTRSNLHPYAASRLSDDDDGPDAGLRRTSTASSARTAHLPPSKVSKCSYGRAATPPPPPVAIDPWHPRESVYRESEYGSPPAPRTTMFLADMTPAPRLYPTHYRHSIAPSIASPTHKTSRLWQTKLQRLLQGWHQWCRRRQRADALTARSVAVRAQRAFAAWQTHAATQRRAARYAQQHLSRVAAACFERWANIGRFSAITKFASTRRANGRVRRLFQSWQTLATQRAFVRRAQAASRLQAERQCVRACFGAWRHVARGHFLQRRHRRSLQRSRDRLVLYKNFHQLHLFAQSQRRPRIDIERSLLSRRAQRTRAVTFGAWRQLQRAITMAKSMRRQAHWRLWQRCHANALAAGQRRCKANRFCLRKIVAHWAATSAGARDASRGSQIALRHATTHCMKRTWRCWVLYKTRRRKYVLGYLKAYKHYSTKWLRKVWRVWGAEAVLHLRHRRAHKQAQLRKVFFGLRHAVFLAREMRRRDKNLLKLEARMQLWTAASLWHRWRRWASLQGRTKRLLALLAYQSHGRLRTRCWSHWVLRHAMMRSAQMVALEDMTRDAQDAQDAAADTVSTLRSTNEALQAQIASLETKLATKDAAVADAYTLCAEKDAAIATLRGEVATTQGQVEENETLLRLQAQAHARDRAEMDAAVQVHVQDVERLQRMLLDVKHELLATSTQLEREKDLARRQVEQLAQQARHTAALEDQLATTEAAAQSNEHLLATERAERQDAAVRCHEYERRLAQTCRDIHTREEDAERELLHARDAAYASDQQRVAVEARNAELLKLLHEKNAHVAALSSQVESLRSSEATKVTSLLQDVQATIAMPPMLSRSNQEVALDTELAALDVHTKSIHDDIRSLQDRLLQRLHQAPLHPAPPHATMTPPKPKRRVKPKTPLAPARSSPKPPSSVSKRLY